MSAEYAAHTANVKTLVQLILKDTEESPEQWSWTKENIFTFECLPPRRTYQLKACRYESSPTADDPSSWWQVYFIGAKGIHFGYDESDKIVDALIKVKTERETKHLISVEDLLRDTFNVEPAKV